MNCRYWQSAMGTDWKLVRLARTPTLGSAVATAWVQILSLKEYWSDPDHSCS